MGRTLRTTVVMAALAVVASSCVYLQRVTVDANNAQFSASINTTDVSADGTFVVFSTPEALSPLDTNTHEDVYRKNTQTGAVHLVSRDGTTVGNGPSARAAMSDDGRFIAFESKATNLTGAGPADTNGELDVFLHDVMNLTTIRVSLTQAGTEATASSFDADISGNGEIVAFTSKAALDPSDANDETDIYVHGLGSTVEGVSDNFGGLFGSGASRNAALGPDGDFIVFESDVLGFAPGDGPHTDIYTREIPDGFILTVNTVTGGFANDDSSNPAIDDSSFVPTVVFESDATNLVAGDTNNRSDVFVRDMLSLSSERVSVDSNGMQSDADSSHPSITDGGDLIAFETSSAILHAQGTGRRSVVHDRDDGRTVAASATEIEPGSTVLSRNGLYVLFESPEPVISPDTNGPTLDGFLVWWSEPKLTHITPAVFASGTTTSVTLSGNGFNRLADTDVWTDFGSTQGITFSNIDVVDSETITADMTVSGATQPGTYNLAVEGSGTGPGIFSGALAPCLECLDIT